MNKKISRIIHDTEPSHMGWGIFLLGLILFTLGMGDQAFGLGVEESRYVLFAQKMLHTGPTAFPLLRNEFYPDYPATYTIMVYLFSLLGHKVTFFTAVLPSALASAWILMLTYRIAAFHSARWGMYAVLFALGTYEFLLLARMPSPDPLVAAAAVMAFFLLYRDYHNASHIASWGLPLLLLGGFLIRGPLGLIIPALVACSFYLCENQYKRFILTAAYSLLLLIVCTALMLIIAQQVAGPAFAKQVLYMQAVGRMMHLGQRSFYYYFVNGVGAFALAFPVAILAVMVHAKELLGGGIKTPTHTEYRLLRHLVMWVLTVLIILSLSKEKHFRYVVVIAPPLALLAGYIFISCKPSRFLHFIRRCLVIGGVLFPFVGLLFVTALLIINRFWLALPAYYLWATFLFVMLIIVGFYIRQQLHEHKLRQLMGFVIGIATWLVLFITIAEPIAEQQLTSIKPVVDAVERVRTPEQHIVLYKMLLDREGLKFMVLLEETAPPPFLMSEQALVNYKQPAIFIARTADYADLPETIKQDYKVVWSGKQARRAWTVFMN